MPSSGIYMQLKGNILKNYTVELISNAQSQLGTFIFPLEPLTPPRSKYQEEREIAWSRLALVRIE